MRLPGVLGRWLGPRPRIGVRLLIRGRIGDGWHDVDRVVKLAEGATLETLLREADRQAIPLREAIEHSPHLRDTLMLNGERCAVEENLGRPLADGDEVFLLAPVAGGMARCGAPMPGRLAIWSFQQASSHEPSSALGVPRSRR